jgi:kynureninase
MTRHLLDWVDRAAGQGFSSIAPRDPDRLAGTVAVNVPDALAVSRALKARDYVIDYRPGVGIRVSPHFYNTADEIDRLMEEMTRIVKTKDYDVAANPGSLVT